MTRRETRRIGFAWRASNRCALIEYLVGGSTMANHQKRVPENVPGDFFVDSTCIDCDACRQIAPKVFGQAVQTSFVHSQPSNADDRRSALHALLSCPTGSIGSLGSDDVKSVMPDFPLPIEPPVYFCGYTSPKSCSRAITCIGTGMNISLPPIETTAGIPGHCRRNRCSGCRAIRSNGFCLGMASKCS